MYAKFNGIGDDLSDDDDALVPSSSSSSKQHPDAARARTLLLQHEAVSMQTDLLPSTFAATCARTFSLFLSLSLSL